MTGFRQLYHQFPRQFWVVVGVHFIDKIGGTIVFPFFALYITGKFNVGMTEAGILLGLLSLAGIVGSVIGGGLTDRLGRRKLILFGLVASALSALTLGSVNQFAWLFPAAAFVGLFSEVGGPAHAAMIADILPKEQRQEGFGILRVIGNMAWLVGPTVGGFVARTSFFALFVIDAAISCLVAVLFYVFMAETRPAPHERHVDEGFVETFRNYRIVLRDKPFVAFLGTAILMGMVYIQMYNSLSVYLRDNHGIEPQRYGVLLTSSAITVICFQFWTTRIIKIQPQFLMMALGTMFYLIGFGMFGIVSAYRLFVLAVVIISVGEMIVMPTSQTLAAGFARTDMRGRYMAVFNLSVSVPAAVGPLAAGIVLDNFAPNLLWLLAAIGCAVSASGFYALHVKLGAQPRFAPAPAHTRPAALAMEAELGDLELSRVAHVIQLSVAPVFLLTGIGAILAVMTNRLGRIIDRARVLEAQLESASDDRMTAIEADLATLSKRAGLIGPAITLCTATALFVCTVIAVLFLGAFLHFDASVPVALLFIAAMLAFFLGLLSFLREIYLATSSLRIASRRVHPRLPVR